ncbi:MAG: succinylglutamate desuccinylase [Pseudomonadales bacterium]
MLKPRIHFLPNPAPSEVADTIEAFLHQLTGPTLISKPGKDPTRTRAIATLLHGNEPSGLRAVHQWLQSGEQPAVNIICFIGSVQAALHEELFKHRMVPGQRDLNRCFRAAFGDYPGKIAEHFLQILDQQKPECLIDIHNTSGSGPAFGVVTYDDSAHRALVALFTRRMVITDHRLKSLMEISDANMPVVTIECGGAQDPAAHQLAEDGLQRYLFDTDVLQFIERDDTMDVYLHPIRLELAENTIIAFAEQPVAGAHLTIPSDVEKFNFGVVESDTLLAWLGEEGEDILQVNSAAGDNVLSHYFTVREGGLYPLRPLKLFMVTSNPTIAISDCLLYAASVRPIGG